MTEIALLKHGPIAEIRLNRPEVLNAMGRNWPTDMQSAITEICDDPEIRVALLTAEGRSFCSGADLPQLAADRIIPLAKVWRTGHDAIHVLVGQRAQEREGVHRVQVIDLRTVRKRMQEAHDADGLGAAQQVLSLDSDRVDRNHGGHVDEMFRYVQRQKEDGQDKA